MSKEYYQANKERILAQTKAYYTIHKDKLNAIGRARQKANHKALRIEVLSEYSQWPPSCGCCGEREIRFLTIDHVDGGGNKHRKKIKTRGVGVYSWLRKNNYPPGFQVLCMNCNHAKGIDGKCPHQDEKNPLKS